MAQTQKHADELIAAYIICGDTLNPLEREHGYITDVRRSGEDYVWYFSDRSSVKLDKNGKLL